jgi:hypothetical protein
MQYFKAIISSTLLALTAQTSIAGCNPRDFTGTENEVLSAYIAYYGRPADTGGLQYWVNQLEAEFGSLSNIIEAFGESQEFVDRYGHLTNEQLVANLFQQLFGRDPDPAGLEYYVGELTSGRTSLQSMSINILKGAQNEDLTIVQNRLMVAQHFVTYSETYPEKRFLRTEEYLENVDADFVHATTSCGLIGEVKAVIPSSIDGVWANCDYGYETVDTFNSGRWTRTKQYFGYEPCKDFGDEEVGPLEVVAYGDYYLDGELLTEDGVTATLIEFRNVNDEKYSHDTNLFYIQNDVVYWLNPELDFLYTRLEELKLDFYRDFRKR